MSWIVEKGNGIFLPEINWHLDARKPASNVFISHAHFDHFGNHPSILCSKGTAHLLKARMPGERNWIAHDFQKEFEFAPGVRAELYPAGHIPGSAMLLLKKEDSSLLYTGDFKLSENLSAEACVVPKADTLIIETTYGTPKYVFPSTSEVVKEIVLFCVDTLEDGYTPILFCYSLGKAQEILKGLEGTNLPILLHPQVLKMTRACEEIGFSFPTYSEFSYEKAGGSVVISPPLSKTSNWLRGIPKRRTAMISGWALDSSNQFTSRTDRSFPLSDHADFLDLLEFVNRVDPKVVYTTHGFAREFAESLKERGFNAWELGAQNQMGLELSVPPTAPTKAAKSEPPIPSDATPDSIANFSLVSEEAGKADSHRRKAAIVTDYFSTLSATDVSIAALFLSGRAFPRASRRKLRIDSKLNRQAVLFAAEANETDYKRARQSHGNPETALLSLLKETEGKSTSLKDFRGLFDNLDKSPNPVFQHSLLAETYRKLNSLEAKSLFRIIANNRRTGIDESAIEEALAARFNASSEAIKRANLRCSDLEQVSNAAMDQLLDYVPIHLFFPLILEKPANGEMDFEFLSQFDAPIWVEDLFDGLRCQIHKVDERVELYNAAGTRITHRFPEIADSATLIPQDYVADGILVAWKKERPLPYSELEKRLNLPVEDLFLGEEVDTLLWLHDLFWFNGESLLDHPLSMRKRELDTFSVNLKLRISPVHQIDSTEKLPSLLQDSQNRGNSGLIIKDATQRYNPLSPTPSWFALK